MFVLSGSNVHGQWPCAELFISKFQDITLEGYKSSFKLQEAQLLCSNWSYNIFVFKDTFYLAGALCDSDSALIEVKLPDQLKFYKHTSFILTGNDLKLYLINKTSYDMWLLNIEDIITWNWQHKKMYTPEDNIFTNEQESPCKVAKKETVIVKAVPTPYSFILLTSEGSIYDALTKIDTSHCVGHVCDVDYGYEHGILLTDKGHIYTWGNGKRCQLGHGDLITLEEPTEVEALSGIRMVKVKAGGWHSLALSEFGDLYAWGWNDTGQLGIRSGDEKKEGLNSYPVPTLVELFDNGENVVETNVKDIACGSRHSAIVLEDNTVWTTGINKYGQLGFGPEEIPKLDSFKKSYVCEFDASVQCGHWSTCILST